jgi:sulfopyruvate decarboxylase subunit alpha
MGVALTSEKLFDILTTSGIDFLCGVPDSIIKNIVELAEKSSLPYIPATCEDVAVGIAAGAYLAGKRPCVLMQNSGLGNSGDSFMTLAKLYHIPIFFIIGVPHTSEEKDSVERANNIQHADWERLTVPVLEALECPYVFLGKEASERDVSRALRSTKEKMLPAALLIRKGYLD